MNPTKKINFRKPSSNKDICMTNGEDYLTPNSQTPEDLPKTYTDQESVSTPVKKWPLANSEENSAATNLFLNRLKPIPLPGLTIKSTIDKQSSTSIISQNRSQVSPSSIKRPPPPIPPPPKRPVPTIPAINRNLILRTDSSNSSSSLSSSFTSRSAQSTSSSRDGVVPDFVDIEVKLNSYNGEIASHSAAKCDFAAILAPGLRNRDWFHGKLTREETEDRLIRFNKNGGFLIRYKQDRTENIPYSLSVFCDKVYHLQIRYIAAGNRYALGREKLNELTFKGLQALVEHHKVKPLQLIRIDDDSLSKSTKLTGSPPRP